MILPLSRIESRGKVTSAVSFKIEIMWSVNKVDAILFLNSFTLLFC